MQAQAVADRPGRRPVQFAPVAEDGDLPVRLAAGDEAAWDKVVEKYGGLVLAVARMQGLGVAEAADVSQATWLRLLQHATSLRRPERLGAWLATTARRESIRLLRARRREIFVAEENDFDHERFEGLTADAGLLASERNAALSQAFATLPAHCQRLLRLLMASPPPSYAEVSSTLGLPIGSIGPTRARCLDCLRRSGLVRSIA